MNIPASLGDHFAKLKSQLMYREMQENLFIPRQRQVMPNDLFAALMPSHNASAAANQAMQLHMLLQQYFVKSALFNHHQQAALKSIFPPQEKDSLLKSPPIVGKSSAFTPFLKSPERHQLKNSFADPLFVTPYGEKCLKVRDSSNLSPKGASPNSLKSCTLECSKPVFWAPNTKKRKQKAENNFSTKKKKLTDDAAKKSSRKSASCDQSPISGILIRKLNKPKDRVTRNKDGTTNTTITSPEMKRGDIDSKYNVVDRSDESKEKLASITNVIGDYTCRLCQDTYLDVYELAEHQCPSIIYIEYKCPECHKAFNCPANLASHRRWHKPRPLTSAAQKLQQNSGTAKVSLEKSNTLVTKQPDIFSPPLDVTA